MGRRGESLRPVVYFFSNVVIASISRPEIRAERMSSVKLIILSTHADCLCFRRFIFTLNQIIPFPQELYILYHHNGIMSIHFTKFSDNFFRKKSRIKTAFIYA